MAVASAVAVQSCLARAPPTFAAASQLRSATFAQVREEAAKAATRRRASKGRRAAHTAKVHGAEVADIRAFDDDGMLSGVLAASEAQRRKEIPTSALAVLQANAEAEVARAERGNRRGTAASGARGGARGSGSGSGSKSAGANSSAKSAGLQVTRERQGADGAGTEAAGAAHRGCDEDEEHGSATGGRGRSRASAVTTFATRTESGAAARGDARADREAAVAMLDSSRVRDRLSASDRRELQRVEAQRKALSKMAEQQQARARDSGLPSLSSLGIAFDFEAGPALTADQRWEGVRAPEARAQEADLPPEDPGPADDPRPLVPGIAPFFKYGYLPPLHCLYLQRAASFYSRHRLKHVLARLVNQEDETALRQLDWLVTNYCRETNLCVVGRDGKMRHVYTWYVALREALRKRHFEPFGKKWRVAFEVDGRVHRTTAGQAVFLMEAYNAGVLEYAKQHCAEIDLHLRRQHRRRDRRRQRAQKTQGRYKRAPLTEPCQMSTTIVQEGDEAMEALDVGDDEDFLRWLQRRRRRESAASASARADSRRSSRSSAAQKSRAHSPARSHGSRSRRESRSSTRHGRSRKRSRPE